MRRRFKNLLLELWLVERFIRLHIRWSSAIHARPPLVVRPLSAILDRCLLFFYGTYLVSPSIRVRALSIAHPDGMLLGGDGLRSSGRVAINAGVKFVGGNPRDPEYPSRHAEGRVFNLGENVVIGVNSVVVGRVDICDNVIVSAFVRKVSDQINDDWLGHLQA
jgi:serine O-acetyltransferase